MILNEYEQIANDVWLKLPDRFPNFELDVFQIMPNHMHGIIALNVGATLALAQNAVAQNDVIAPNDVVAPNDDAIRQNDAVASNDDAVRQNDAVASNDVVTPNDAVGQNAGVKISETKNLWVDAGIFASHIGFESAIGAVCWNMTRSILAENSPYYVSGAKISYTSNNEEWFLSGLILNGWQRIQRVPGNQTPAFGHQLTWTPNRRITLNSSSFIGSDTPYNTRQMRYFHNLYGQFQLSEKIGLITGFDIGAQQRSRGSSDYDVWYSPVIIARYTATDKLAFAGRAEYYKDEEEVITTTGTPNGFNTFGYSLNMDVRVMDNVLWRLEARTLNSRRDRIFLDKNEMAVRNNYFAGTSLSIAF